MSFTSRYAMSLASCVPATARLTFAALPALVLLTVSELLAVPRSTSASCACWLPL